MRTLHLGLRVADLQRSLAFYTGLGYEVQGRVPGTELGTLTMLKLPGDEFVSLELVDDSSEDVVEPGSLSHLVVQVEDLHATVARLAVHGIEAAVALVRVEAARLGSPDGSKDFWTSWIDDPDGHRIELVQWPSGHPDGMTAADLAGTEGTR